MRFTITCVLYLIFYSFGCPSYGHQDTTKENTLSHTHLVSDILWAKHLESFKERLDTKPEAARLELQNIAKKLFNKHLLVDEWIPLYFRLNQNGTDHLSDVTRLSELEIRMLTDIDTIKYATQIQSHQEILTQLNRNANVFHRHDHIPEEKNIKTKPSTSQLDLRNERLRTDLEAVRTELLKQAISRGYVEHPHLEKWVSIGVKLFTTDSSTLGDVTTFVELQIQMLKDSAPETESEKIQELERTLADLNKFSKERKIAGPIRVFVGLPDKPPSPKKE